MKNKINYKLNQLPKWDLTLVEIVKVDRTMKIHKVTLKQDKELFRISIPKMQEWNVIEEGQKIFVTLDEAPRGGYAKLYNMSERNGEDFVKLN